MHRHLGLAGLASIALLAPLLALPADREDVRGVAWLGVKLSEPSGDSSSGVPVLNVFADSPAAESGLRARDVIVAVDGVRVGDPRELIERIRGNDPGAWLPLTVLRQGEERDLRVRLSRWPADPKALRVLRGWIGIQAIPLPETLRRHFGAPPDAGVMISEVTPASPAEAAGFEVGDVVFEVDGDKVTSPAELQRSVSHGGVGNERAFTAVRDGLELVLEARIEAATPGD